MMDERTIAVSIPSDLYAELGSFPAFNGKIKQKIQLDLAIGMFVSKATSLSRAAAYANMALMDFVKMLSSYGVPIVDYSEEMLADDMAFIEGCQQ
jgi:predicted HTH domain antitoxin